MTGTSSVAPDDTAATSGPGPGPSSPRHSGIEDALGVVTGAVIASFGLFLLKGSAAVTGGTAGLSLLIGYAAPVPFGVIFFAVNVPFFALALWKKGWNFTLRTVAAVGLVSGFASLHTHALRIAHLEPVYGVVLGNLLTGVGLLILFRHQASLGGFNILALLLQERLGWRAGYVQMAMDVLVVLGAFTVVSPGKVALSAGGAIVLNLVLALNHRPGRYLGT